MRLSLFLSALLLLPLTACQEDAPPVSDGDLVVEDTLTVDDDARSGFAVADITELAGSGVTGRVAFRALGNDGVQIDYELVGLPGGDHGFHIHENGSCEPDSTGTPGGAAGGHFNPLDSPHGPPSESPSARHAGDLGNITATANATRTTRGTIADSVLTFGALTNVVGKAVVVHSGADDLSSQPSGDAGSRIACGVIRPAEEPDRPGALGGTEVLGGTGMEDEPVQDL